MTTDRSTVLNEPLILWGTPHSLYTGKVRSYLIKKGLHFTESMPHRPRFQAEIVTAIRHVVVPVVETADGALYEDSTVIIDELERRNVTVLLKGPRPEHLRILQEVGAIDRLAHEKHLFDDLDEAIAHARIHAERVAG